MPKYNCIIVEDEPLAAEVLQDYISQVTFLEFKGICNDAIFAMDKLKKEPIDLIFLDIHLPKLKGLDFIRTLKSPPNVIITTAYQDYALEGYDLNVLDYLIKPIEFARFLTSVNKLRQLQENSTMNKPIVAEKAHLFFVVGKKKVRICLDDILYIESIKEYIRITTTSKSILTKYQLSEVEELLPKNFLRVHRSYIVAIDKIDAYSSTEIEINKKLIPIGRSYKELIISVLK